MKPNDILKLASYFQSVARKPLRKVAGETLLLLKELEVIKDSLNEIVWDAEDKLIERLSKQIPDESSDELREGAVADYLRPIFKQTFERAFPGETIYIEDSYPALVWLHEVLHLTIDPQHEIGQITAGQKSSKGRVETAMDEFIINVIEGGTESAQELVDSSDLLHAVGEFYGATYDDKVTCLEEAIEVWGSAPIKNPNKARLLKDALSTIKHRYSDKLDIDDDEELQQILANAAHDLAILLTEKTKQFISYMPEEREAKLKIFLRLLKRQFDAL